MCSNFHAATLAYIQSIIDGDVQGDLFADRDVWPGYEAPIITLDRESGKRRAEPAIYGLVPHWAKDTKITRSTYNARSETVAEKPSFRTAWKHANFCLIPASWYYEPRYGENGKPVRWSIRRNDCEAFCIAGIYWRPKGEGVTDGLASFSMLTVNADDHPVLNKFHDPKDEKRSIVHIVPSEFDAWLRATTELARVMLAAPEPDVLVTEAAPLPPRKSSKTKSGE